MIPFVKFVVIQLALLHMSQDNIEPSYVYILVIAFKDVLHP